MKKKASPKYDFVRCHISPTPGRHPEPRSPASPARPLCAGLVRQGPRLPPRAAQAASAEAARAGGPRGEPARGGVGRGPCGRSKREESESHRVWPKQFLNLEKRSS